MSNNINYAVIFSDQLKQKYSRELLSSGLTSEGLGVNFIGGQTVRIPFLNLGGYKKHNRDGGFARGNVENGSITKVLKHDRSVEFFVDSMDVDETNQVLAATNLTNIFETEHAIPEIDAMRFSGIFTEWTEAGGKAETVALTKDNVMDVFDSFMQAMDEAEVPSAGRILYVTPATNKLLMLAAEKNRVLNALDDGAVKRTVRMLDEVEVVVVPQSRMRTAYNFDNGFVPMSNAKLISMMLIHPSSVVAVSKHSYIKLWSPGTHTQGDGYLYQNRQYGDIFVIDSRKDGIAVVTA